MGRMRFFIAIGAICVVLAVAGYRAYDSYETGRTVDAVYDWMKDRSATPKSKAEIRAWIDEVQARYAITAADARKAVRSYTVDSR